MGTSLLVTPLSGPQIFGWAAVAGLFMTALVIVFLHTFNAITFRGEGFESSASSVLSYWVGMTTAVGLPTVALVTGALWSRHPIGEHPLAQFFACIVVATFIIYNVMVGAALAVQVYDDRRRLRITA